VRLQVMSYALVGYDKSYWDGLDSALRRAAARGVEVELIVADWSMDAKKEPWIKSLSVLPRTTVKVVSIPQPDGDFIEFGRVAHSKFLTVDGEVGWIGTSNAAGDYFFKSRNVGLLVRGAPLVADLDRRFELTWTSAYADSVKPGRAYHAPPRTRKDRDAAPKGDGGGKGDKAGG
jgi:phosphatidylserine/phosphatidylglycerophosphate/cardiolipin synthase-like enzyme